jgi:hypothetical protein
MLWSMGPVTSERFKYPVRLKMGTKRIHDWTCRAGACRKLRKATVSFIMSVCQSDRLSVRMELGFH